MVVYRRITLLLLALWSVYSVQATGLETLNIQVFQENTTSILSEAIVRIAPLVRTEKRVKDILGFTDKQGNYSFPYNEPVVVQISYLGFQTITDTITNLQAKTYTLTQSSANLKDVVVTGQYSQNAPKNSVYSIQTITEKQLKEKGANNLREALMTELKVDISQDPQFGSGLSINGVQGEGVKILMDGVPLLGRLNGQLDLSQINLSNVERIEVVEGPMSVLYGSDAMGGVVNIITKTRQQEKLSLNLKGYYETVGQYNVELNGGLHFKKSQLFFDAGRNFFGGFSSPDTNRYKDWKPKEQYFADLKYVYSDNRFKASVSGNVFRELLLDRSNPQLEYVNDTTPTYAGIDGHFLTWRYNAAANFTYIFKENTQLDALLSYSGYQRFLNYYNKDLVTLKETPITDSTTLSDTTRYNQFFGKAVYTIPAKQYHLSFLMGVEANYENSFLTRISGRERNLGNYAAFGSVRFTLFSKLDIQPAVRFAYNSKFNSPLVPSINFKYAAKENLLFRASYSMGYRTPTLKELYLDFVDANHHLFGDSLLKPEQSHNVNLTVDYTKTIGKQTIGVNAGGFFNHINDHIVFKDSDVSRNIFVYGNILRYRTYGGSAGLSYHFNQRLQLQASASLTGYAYDFSDTSKTTKALSPDFTFTAGYKIPKVELGISVYYKYNGQKPVFSTNNNLSSGFRSPYHTVNISVYRNFWNDRIQVVAGGKNLVGVTNVHRENVTGAVGHDDPNNANINWGRTFFVSLNFHFTK